MILVDTNVWSEALRAQPDARVVDWAHIHSDNLWLSTVVLAELLSGAHMLPEGLRKQAFLESYHALVESHIDRIAVFDLAAARHYGPLVATLEKAGRNPGTADAQIAATAKARGMAIATRNERDFEGLGLRLINPWNG